MNSKTNAAECSRACDGSLAVSRRMLFAVGLSAIVGLAIPATRRIRLIETWKGRLSMFGDASDPHNWFMSDLGDADDYDALIFGGDNSIYEVSQGSCSVVPIEGRAWSRPWVS